MDDERELAVFDVSVLMAVPFFGFAYVMTYVFYFICGYIPIDHLAVNFGIVWRVTLAVLGCRSIVQLTGTHAKPAVLFFVTYAYVLAILPLASSVDPLLPGWDEALIVAGGGTPIMLVLEYIFDR